jgi:hypothetical protein
VPEPIEYDPFEMDWPWPGMLPAEPEARASTPAPEPSATPEPAADEAAIDYEELR